MATIPREHVSLWETMAVFMTDRVLPVLTVCVMFMILFGLGCLLYTILSQEARPHDTDFSYTNWDGHEYVVMHKGNSWGVTHSPRCKCIPGMNKILQEDRKPGIWMYMDVPVTNLPPMYYWDGKPSIMLCESSQ